MINSNDLTKTALILTLGILFAASAAAQQEGITIDYNYNLDDVEAFALDCNDGSCSSVTNATESRGASYSEIHRTSNGVISINYPKDLSTSDGYAEYHFAEGYVPMEYNVKEYCVDTNSCSESYNIDFYKIDQCSATVDQFSVTNDVYANEPIVVDITSSTSSDVSSAFEEAGPVDHVPQDYKDQYYSAKTNVSLEVTDNNGDTVYTDEIQRNIYMSESTQVEFGWTPSTQGDYNVQVSTDVVDNKCASSTTSSSSKDLTVQEERPQEEYYTLLNDLTISDDHPKATQEQTFTFSKISNYAGTLQPDRTIPKTPVQTEATYNITDPSGTSVYTDTQTLDANSDAQNKEFHSFNWTPTTDGEHTIKVTGESVETEGDYPTTPETVSMTVQVDPQPTWTLNFKVNDPSGSPVENAKVEIEGTGKTSTTDVYGEATITGLTKGDYTYNVSKSSFQTSSAADFTIDSKTSDPTLKSVTLHNENTAPTVKGIPDVEIEKGGTDSQIDLDKYVNDDQTPASEIKWTNSSNNQVDVQIDSNNIVTLTPDPAWTGTESITFTAEDTGGALDSDTIAVNVVDANDAPTISNIEDVTIDEDTSEYDYINMKNYVSDDKDSFDNLDISLTVDNDKCGVSLEDDGFIDIQPNIDFYGTCQVTVEATDSSGRTGSHIFNVNINPVNDAPKITSSAPTNTNAYSKYYYQLRASDADDGTRSFTYSIEQGPQELTINNNGEVEWDYPDTNDVGTHTITLKVSDGEKSDTETYDLEVTDATQTTPPNADITTNTTKGGAPLNVEFDGSQSNDPDGTIDTYSWSFGDGTNANGQTATHKYTQPGIYTATLEITDNASAKDTESIQINVTGNNRPSFTSAPVTTAKEGEEYSYTAQATDEDGDIIEYSLNKKPSEMSIDNATGEITWTPTSTTDQEIIVQASDGEDTATQTYTITVNKEDEEDDDDSGGGGGGGGGGSGGGGGGSSSFGGLSVTSTTPIEDRVSFDSGTGSDSSYQFNTSTGEGSITLNFQENTTLNISVSEDLAGIIQTQESITGVEGESTDLRFNITEPVDTNQTTFKGNITLTDSENSDETLDIPLTINRDSTEETVGEVDLRIGVFSDQTIRDGSFQYSIRVRDNAETGSTEQVTINTTLYDTENNLVFQENTTTAIGETVSYQPENIQPGEHRLEATVTYKDQQFNEERTLQLQTENENRITGGFFSSASSIVEAFQGLIDGIRNLFS